MYGQGNYALQFRQGHPPHPPSFQQGPPPFQQGLPPPPPPPPVNHDGHSAAPPHAGQPPNHHSMYRHGPPPPPPPSSFQHGGPPHPSQTFMQPTISGYMNSSMPINTRPSQNAQFPAPMPHLGATLNGPGNSETIRAPLPPRVFPPPLSHGQMMFANPHQPPQSIGQGIQHTHLLPPPPSMFVSVTPAPFSIPQPPPEHAHPPSMPPPPPPPPPSSPPPLPPPPPPPPASSPDPTTRSSTVPSFMPLNTSSTSQHLEKISGSNRVSDVSEVVTESVGKGNIISDISGVTDSIDRAVGAEGNMPEGGDHPIVNGGTSYNMPMVEDMMSSKTHSALATPPPEPTAKEIVRQIEVLCQYIARNGPEFEITARKKEHGNPKFAFLFGGEPGSEAAIAHEYFQWVKRKCLMEIKSPNGSERSGSALKVECSVSPNRHMNVEASDSPADSDMDMEDDTHQINKDQGDGASVEVTNASISMDNEVLNMQEQQLENQRAKDYLLRESASSKIESSSDIPVSAMEEREYAHIPLGSSAGGSECTSDVSTGKSTLPLEGSTPNKASPAPAACINYKEVSDPVCKIGSPFRLIQDYASDDSGEADDKPSFEDVSPERVLPSVTVGNKSLQEDVGTDKKMDRTPLSSLKSEKEMESLAESSLSSPTVMPANAENISTQVVEATVAASGLSDAIAETHEHNDNHICQSSNDLGHRDSFRDGDELDTQNGKLQKRGDKQDSAVMKVDEFGRMVKEGTSDSDSDMEHHGGRRYRRGRSRSPLDRRRRRSRSPRRRNEKRNRSRSWSPRKRRSMSKSRSPPAAFRHTGEFSGEKMRRDRDHIPDCYDFIKGRCHRGASCRFQHHKPGSGDAARNYRGRHQQHTEDPHDSSKSAARRDSQLSVDKHEVNTVNANNKPDVSEEDLRTKLPCDDMAVSYEKRDACFSVDDTQFVTSVLISQSATTNVAAVGLPNSHEAVGKGLENQQVLETLAVIQDNEIPEAQEEIHRPLSTSGPTTTEAETRDMSIRTPPTDSSLRKDAVHQPSEANDKASSSSASVLEKPFPDQSTSTSTAAPSESFPPQHMAPKEFPPVQLSAEGYQLQHSQLPLPPPPPPPRNYNVPPVSTNVYSQPPAGERYPPPYQAPPLNDPYSQSVASNSSWTSLPPPPPISHSQSYHSSQFQQNLVPPTRPYQHGDLSHSQPMEFRPTGDLHRPPLGTEGIPFEYPKVLRDERFPHSSMLDGNRFHPGPQQASSLLREEHHFPLQAHDSRNFQPYPSQRFTGLMGQDNSHVRQFPDGNSISKGDFGGTAANHSFIQQQQQQQQPGFGMQWSGATSFPSHLGSAENAGPSVRRYPMGFDDEAKPPHLPVDGGSRISAHYNPFASTFNNIPDRSQYNSSFKQESITNPVGRYDSLAFPPVLSRSGGQTLAKSGDPYDPLFDSIEPSKASMKYESIVGRSTVESPAMIHVTIKKEEKEEKEGVGASTSPENDDFAEVGAVESGSPDNPDKAIGDIEMDQQVESSKGKSSKKGKDSRSMKLFKVSLAEFVKDVLKPSWRQGNMSKEAFKTIVKKTVDKVAGAMKNNQVPKGQAKIDQYIETSQRKLTKLVTGYVDKYVKS